MFRKKRMLEDEIIRLKYRIADLEERICPCEDHDWKEIDYYYASYLSPFDCTIYKYKCKRCGKLKEEEKML